MKKQVICLLVFLWSINSFAQTNAVKDLYEDFKEHRTTNDDKPSQIVKTLELLKLADQLTQKQITNVNYDLGKMYEDIEEADIISIYTRV